MPIRTASATWKGGLKGGTGEFNTPNGMSAPYSFGSRFESAKGSSPEELLAAAEAACFSMALSSNLEKNGTVPTKVETTAQCFFEKGDAGFKVSRMKLSVRAQVSGVDESALRRIAETTKDTCPVSQALKGNVTIEVETALA